ncbi:MAG: site-2 protease family protein [Cyclobacteriaceae bacterium]
MLKKFLAKKWSHPLLFLLTLGTTTCSGSMHQNIWTAKNFTTEDLQDPGIAFFLSGLYFSLSFLFILSVHEFGHYFTAKYHKVKATLPYYIPLIFPFKGLQIGTMGAVIAMKERIKSKKQIFDVGIAGPLAGFVAAILLLSYGFTHLPSPEKIYEIHAEYEQYGTDYAQHVYANAKEEGAIKIGTNLIFEFFKHYVAESPDLVPNSYELMHYPFLFAGFLSLFFTALNLFPIGQLDGGHVLYGLIGYRKFKTVSKIVFTLLVTFAGIGLPFLSPYQSENTFSFILYLALYVYFVYFVYQKVVDTRQTAILFAVAIVFFQFVLKVYFPTLEGYNGWLVYCILLSRVLGVYHPKAEIEEPLDLKRKILGWVSLVIFILCFSPQPLQ